MANISLLGVTKDYGNGVLAVDDLNLEIVDGEFLIFCSDHRDVESQQRCE